MPERGPRGGGPGDPSAGLWGVLEDPPRSRDGSQEDTEETRYSELVSLVESPIRKRETARTEPGDVGRSRKRIGVEGF